MSGFPSSLPFTELWLVNIHGQWPVHSYTTEEHVLHYVRNLNPNDRRQVRIWKITSLELEQLDVQREVVREALVPYGTAVDS